MLIFNSFFEDLNTLFYGQGGYKSFPVDMIEIENGFQVIAEMPGVLKEDVKMSFEDGALTIEADRKKDADAKYLINEREVLRLKRTINFGEINEDSINAKMENGLLYVTIKTKAPEEKPKKTIIIE